MTGMSVYCIIGRTCTTIFIVLCVLCTIDTHLFVYPSLSRALAFSACALLLTLLAAIIEMKDYGKNGHCELFAIAWGTYIVIHCLCAGAEIYRVYYIISSLMLSWALTKLLRHGVLQFRTIGNGLLLIAIVHLAFMAVQVTGIAEPLSAYFQVTGSNENPNITAMYLAGCLPLLLHRVSKQGNGRAIYMSLLLITLAAIMAIRCRTAYIGIATMGATWCVCTSQIRDRFTALANKQKACAISIAIVLLASCGSMLYLAKKNSADGRMLVWKLSAQMIAERPQGYGYGLFERNYNLRQAEYFAAGEATAEHCHNASFVAMAYNDYLEQGTEGGGIGLLFYLSFYALLTYTASKSHDRQGLAVILGMAVMASVNFMYCTIQPWLLLICYSSRVAATEETSSHRRNDTAERIFPILMAGTVCLMAYRGFSMTTGQIYLKRYYEKIKAGQPADSTVLKALYPGIGTSELYWRTTAQAMMTDRHYDEAAECLTEARKYTSAPALFFKQAVCYIKTGQADKAVECLNIVSHILPQNLRSRAWLMEIYDKNNLHEKAVEMAKEITNMPVKVKSKEALHMKRKAEEYIERDTP